MPLKICHWENHIELEVVNKNLPFYENLIESFYLHMKAENQRETCLPDTLLMQIQQDYILHHMSMNSFLCKWWIVLHRIVTP